MIAETRRQVILDALKRERSISVHALAELLNTSDAREDVRAQVGRVCPSNGEDGVARYLRQTLLQDSAKEVCP